MRQTVVVDGLRNTQSAKPGLEDQPDAPAEMIDRLNERRPQKPKGQAVKYQSRFRSLFLTMEINDDIIVGQKKQRGKNRHVRFVNYQFQTSDPEVIEFLEGLDTYGLRKDFWREADKVELDLAIDANRAIGALRQFNGDLDKLRPHMSAKDFDALMAVNRTLDSQETVLESR